MKLLSLCLLLMVLPLRAQHDTTAYHPTPENLAARQQFSDMKFGIFLHWGIYSMFGQGEWYLNYGPTAEEYAKAAGGFYPARFDAKAWVDAIRDSGARYICFTSRHHDGFSMWHTQQSDYNIVDATPYGRDVIGMLAQECHRQDIQLNLYYSHLDWTRPEYPLGRTGKTTGRPTDRQDWPAYLRFMESQLTELLTQYGKIGAIWFDGFWDHDEDSIPFNWELRRQYDLIHRLQPSCLVANNHHVNIHPGEDIQCFERDVPGDNTAGYSGDMAISRLPLETCQTMNGMWGYKIKDQNYKSVDELIRLLVRTSGKGANLLLNIGPQPNGELPATALDRLRHMGEWLRQNGEAIYGTRAGDIDEQPWGVTTRKADSLYVHILTADSLTTSPAGQPTLLLPLTCRVRSAQVLTSGQAVAVRKQKDGILLTLPEKPTGADYILKLVTRR